MDLQKSKVILEVEQFFEEEEKHAQDPVKKEYFGRLKKVFHFLPRRPFDEKGDVIVSGALVELKVNDAKAYYFVAPPLETPHDLPGQTLIFSIDGKPVQVIPESSVLAQALIGKKPGQRFEIQTSRGVREYQILSLS